MIATFVRNTCSLDHCRFKQRTVANVAAPHLQW
jgi:hypothetical protein